MSSLELIIKIIILPISSMQGKPYSTSTSPFEAKGWTIVLGLFPTLELHMSRMSIMYVF